MKHNLGFDTKYTIFRPDGSIRDIIEHSEVPKAEGKVEIDVLKTDGSKRLHHEQPMRSWVKGFMEHHFGVAGTRLQNSNVPFNTTTPQGMIAGTGSTDVSIGQTQLVAQYTFGTQSSVGTIVQFPTYNPATQCVEMKLAKEAQINYMQSGTSVVIREVGIGMNYSSGSSYALGCRDLITPITVNLNEILRITYTLSFPVSSEKALTKNFMLNLIQLYALSGFDNFVDITGAYRTGTLGTYNTKGMTGAENIYGASANQINRSIAVGSGNTDVDFTDYKLDVPIVGGTSEGQLSALATTSSNLRAMVLTSNSAWFEHYRDFYNGSPSAVTVREAGVFTYPTQIFSNYFMLARWLTGDIVVNRFETLRVSWRPKITV